jgi:hypothetical protein
MEWRADRMTPTLFDPADPPPGIWPAGQPVERAWLEAMAQAGVGAMVSNCRTRWLALRSGDRLFPVTANDGEVGDSYVCLPHSAYSLYARDELDIAGFGASRHVLRPLIAAAGGLLLAGGINRIVHVDNWLLSTNLHGSWRGEDLPAIRERLVAAFPGHILAIRSLDDWSCPALAAAARADGWTMVPSRQVWVTDDPAASCRRRNSLGNDRRLFQRSGLAAETIAEMSPADGARIAELYHQLYVRKYSTLNPVFTAAFVTASHAAGFVRYHVARAPGGEILAVAGTVVRDGVLTAPLVGYDMARPRAEGLYRIACLLFTREAAAIGARLHGSAGAAGFKRARGAHGVIEYSAMYTGHLPRRRRLAVSALAAGLERYAVPMMKSRGL